MREVVDKVDFSRVRPGDGLCDPRGRDAELARRLGNGEAAAWHRVNCEVPAPRREPAAAPSHAHLRGAGLSLWTPLPSATASSGTRTVARSSPSALHYPPASPRRIPWCKMPGA